MPKRLRSDPHFWPFVLLMGTIIVLAVADRSGRFLSMTTAFSTLEIFSNVGLVALGLGLSMMIRNFDISVAGVFSLAGCIAVMNGSVHPWLGIFLALAVGLSIGLLQGLIVVWFRLGAVGVTLGGLLICFGIAHVLTQNRTVPFDNLPVALAFGAPIAGIFSIRSIVTLAIFTLAAFVISYTRLGRDLLATGSDREAAAIAGVSVGWLTIATLGFSGFCSALSGALLSYSLAAASPTGLAEVIVPAAAAAILGGVSLGGGAGRPFGILAGALTLAVLESGLNAIGGPPYLNDVAMGTVLFAVAVVDGLHFARRIGLVQIR